MLIIIAETNVSMDKLKARYCVKVDKKVEDVAAVVNFPRILMMLALSVIFISRTVQVDYTAVFAHAPIDTDTL